MKLDIRMEDGKPAIFWTDSEDVRQHYVICFTLHDGHNEASRAYMRSLPKPKTPEDYDLIMKTLKIWAQIPNR